MILEGEFFSGVHLRWNLGWPTPNYSGAFLVTLLALAFVFSTSRLRWVALATEVVGFFLLAKTYSRQQKGSCFTFYLITGKPDVLADVEARAHPELGGQPTVAGVGGGLHLCGELHFPRG